MADAALAAAAGRRAPKTRKGKRILEQREPQVAEDAKTALIIRGNNCKADTAALLRDLYRMRSPLAMLYMRKHPDHPFEDVARLEAECTKHNHGLFAFGSSSKKRPFRLILGRLFNSKLLDMQEFNIDKFKSMCDFGNHKSEALVGSKPLVIFQGSGFETDERLKRTKSLLLDWCSGAAPEKVMLQGLEQVVVISTLDAHAGAAAAAEERLDGGVAADGGIPPVLFARYRIHMSKSGSKLPRVELEEVGPSFRLRLDRTREPDRDRWKQSIKVPKAAKAKKEKNIRTETMGKRKGRVHLGKQDMDAIHTVHHSKAKDKKLRAELAAKDKKRQQKSGEAPDAKKAKA
mmetsp:Transcript_56951/g.161695  ORF Transcript_56951/g.161695 Transcript_56951/m.161695 type:complete len:346 (-) Transcript_56951:86-1123(-)|eukprot:CAMPEP_0168378956 /NCGR_PEP_ID=MMETSP0228-20121227/11597_1 /TAXON_ID=133427 /ORGANISM="Protoceratium reticulatum, Strain CCCM 535 (=CCMP 1889)" /LENGTH=345 /DNA_ID=CAMNT_0008391977 /DNA_START=47 /DNA_END=1084 /DNA_ORIENTATION=-